jgi:hypothetical protein
VLNKVIANNPELRPAVSATPIGCAETKKSGAANL